MSVKPVPASSGGRAHGRGQGNLLHLFLVVLRLGGELALVDGLGELLLALLFLQRLHDFQAHLVLRLDHRVGDDLGEEVDGADGIVIAGDGEGDSLRVAVGVHDRRRWGR